MENLIKLAANSWLALTVLGIVLGVIAHIQFKMKNNIVLNSTIGVLSVWTLIAVLAFCLEVLNYG